MVDSVAEESVLAGPRESGGPANGRAGDYDRPMVLSYRQIRRCVGAIGVFLPFVLFLGNKIIGHGAPGLTAASAPRRGDGLRCDHAPAVPSG
jgi:hypothetical protein